MKSKLLISVIFLALIFFFKFSEAGTHVLDSTALANAKEYRNLNEALKNPEAVYKLRLRRNRYSTFPEEIFSFKNLHILDLQNNNIREIPDSINKLQNLQEIYLGRNKIEEIPPTLTELEHLSVLSLNRNKIDSLPPEVGNMYSLKFLDLWGTEIVHLPEEMFRLRHTLEKIDMRVIFMCIEQQEKIRKMLPATTIHFSGPMPCEE